MEPNKKDGILWKDGGKLRKQWPHHELNYSHAHTLYPFPVFHFFYVCVHFTAFGSLAKEFMPEQYGVIYDVLYNKIFILAINLNVPALLALGLQWFQSVKYQQLELLIQ